MKNKIIIINSVIICIVLILAYKSFVLINENTSDDKIRKDVVYQQTTNNDISDKEIENKVVKIIEKYYKIGKIKKDYKVIIRYETQKEIYEYLDRTLENIQMDDEYKQKYSSYIDYINKIKDDINYGIINVFVESNDKSKKHTSYNVGLNDKTNEVLYSSSWNDIDRYSMSKEELIEYEKQVINDKEADEIARKFLIQHNIIYDENSSYKNIELRHDNYNSNHVTIFYKDENNNLLNVAVDKNTGKVIGFALGIQAKLDYIRM